VPKEPRKATIEPDLLSVDFIHHILHCSEAEANIIKGVSVTPKPDALNDVIINNGMSDKHDMNIRIQFTIYSTR